MDFIKILISLRFCFSETFLTQIKSQVGEFKKKILIKLCVIGFTLVHGHGTQLASVVTCNRPVLHQTHKTCLYTYFQLTIKKLESAWHNKIVLNVYNIIMTVYLLGRLCFYIYICSEEVLFCVVTVSYTHLDVYKRQVICY